MNYLYFVPILTFSLYLSFWFYYWRNFSGFIGIATFGEKNNDGHFNSKQDFKLIYASIEELTKQQRWAFSLLWLSIFVGIILGTTLCIKLLIANPEIDLGTALTGGGIAIDINLSKKAFSLYRKTMKEMKNLLDKLV